MNNNQSDHVDIYPVGLLYDIQLLIGQRRARKVKNLRYLKPWRNFFKSFRRSMKRRSYFNGYLAELAGAEISAGHGWTKKRALNSLERIKAENMDLVP
ncbi:MAG TPA: hypothetical protein V6C65_20375 [Allocoleopsis sp.]